MIKRLTVEVEVFHTLENGTEVIAVSEVSGYSDSGRCYGPPENCYPPESDTEIGDILVHTDEDIAHHVPWERLSTTDQETIVDKIEDAFWENFENGG